MNERANFGEIGLASFLGCLIGVVLVDFAFMLWSTAHGGFDGGEIVIFLVILLIGGVIALFTAWPLGCMIGWLLSRAERATAAHATITGALTGAAWIGLTMGWAMVADPDGPAYFLVFALGFAVLGAVSGWCGFRIVFRR